MNASTKEDERVLTELLSDRAVDEYPVLSSAAYFSPRMQQELATLVLRAYLAGKEVGSRK